MLSKAISDEEVALNLCSSTATIWQHGQITKLPEIATRASEIEQSALIERTARTLIQQFGRDAFAIAVSNAISSERNMDVDGQNVCRAIGYRILAVQDAATQQANDKLAASGL
jgi:hypothetical protein